MKRDDLPDLILKALQTIGGTGSVTDVAKQIWKAHEQELAASGDLFFTWQYDMRWAAQRLRDRGKLTHSRQHGRAVWQLV
jgi:hypothetical protein